MEEINYCEYAERLEHLRRYPSAFIEDVCGIKLNHYQKVLIDKINKIKPTPRNPMRKRNSYINMAIAYTNMKDDGYIVIATPRKWNKLSKAEFAKYIENYWK